MASAHHSSSSKLNYFNQEQEHLFAPLHRHGRQDLIQLRIINQLNQLDDEQHQILRLKYIQKSLDNTIGRLVLLDQEIEKDKQNLDLIALRKIIISEEIELLKNHYFNKSILNINNKEQLLIQEKTIKLYLDNFISKLQNYSPQKNEITELASVHIHNLLNNNAQLLNLEEKLSLFDLQYAAINKTPKDRDPNIYKSIIQNHEIAQHPDFISFDLDILHRRAKNDFASLVAEKIINNAGLISRTIHRSDVFKALKTLQEYYPSSFSRFEQILGNDSDKKQDFISFLNKYISEYMNFTSTNPSQSIKWLENFAKTDDDSVLINVRNAYSDLVSNQDNIHKLNLVLDSFEKIFQGKPELFGRYPLN